MVADTDFLYLGTANGKVVSVPIQSLAQRPTQSSNKMTQVWKENRATLEKRDVVCSYSLPRTAVALHSHLEGNVKALLNLTLPRMEESKEAVMPPHTHSMPHMSSSSGHSIPVSPPVLNFRSLVISVGEGHVEYKETESSPNEDDSISVHRERHEAFQLLVWGHKDTVI